MKHMNLSYADMVILFLPTANLIVCITVCFNEKNIKPPAISIMRQKIKVYNNAFSKVSKHGA